MTATMEPFLDLPPLPERPDRKARVLDPQPSKDAARHDSFGPTAIRVLAALIECQRATPSRGGATANEIQLRMEYESTLAPDRGSVARRLTSLARKGYVVDTGATRDGGRGVKVTVWRATGEGRAWLAST